MTIGTLFTLKVRTPFGAIDEAPTRDGVTAVDGPPPGGVTVADTTPVCADAEVLVMATFTVSAELLRFAAVFCTTCALPATSGPPACNCTGNWRPVLLSGGTCVQSTLS